MLSEFEAILETPPLRPDLDEMMAMDIQADLELIRQPIAPAAFSPTSIETLFTHSILLRQQGITFTSINPGVWQLQYPDREQLRSLQKLHIPEQLITFDPQCYEERPSLCLLLPGQPIYHELLRLCE